MRFLVWQSNGIGPFCNLVQPVPLVDIGTLTATICQGLAICHMPGLFGADDKEKMKTRLLALLTLSTVHLHLYIIDDTDPIRILEKKFEGFTSTLVTRNHDIAAELVYGDY